MFLLNDACHVMCMTGEAMKKNFDPALDGDGWK